eukprot:scaffold32611_cov19-Tisochrysis_lutea.AAC.3
MTVLTRDQALSKIHSQVSYKGGKCVHKWEVLHQQGLLTRRANPSTKHVHQAHSPSNHHAHQQGNPIHQAYSPSTIQLHQATTMLTCSFTPLNNRVTLKSDPAYLQGDPIHQATILPALQQRQAAAFVGADLSAHHRVVQKDALHQAAAHEVQCRELRDLRQTVPCTEMTLCVQGRCPCARQGKATCTSASTAHPMFDVHNQTKCRALNERMLFMEGGHGAMLSLSVKSCCSLLRAELSFTLEGMHLYQTTMSCWYTLRPHYSKPLFLPVTNQLGLPSLQAHPLTSTISKSDQT